MDALTPDPGLSTLRRFPLRKVYELGLKCSHLFNILDARGAISVTERVALIARVRKLTCSVARIYVERQELEREVVPA
jgi:glycyl-tRNA synthetase alpha chain